MATSAEFDFDELGRVRINTASEAAFSSVCGLTADQVQKILDFRRALQWDANMFAAVLQVPQDVINHFNFEAAPGNSAPSFASDDARQSSLSLSEAVSQSIPPSLFSHSYGSYPVSSSFSSAGPTLVSYSCPSTHPTAPTSVTFSSPSTLSSYPYQQSYLQGSSFSGRSFHSPSHPSPSHPSPSHLSPSHPSFHSPSGRSHLPPFPSNRVASGGSTFRGTVTPPPPPLIPFQELRNYQYPPPNLANLERNFLPPPERTAPSCRQLTLPRGLSFDGSGSWSTFIEKFRDFIFVNRIEEHHEKLYLFRMALTGTASEHLRLIMLHAPSTMESVYSKMESRFGDHELPQSASMQLRYMKQIEGEPVEVWADKVFKLTHQAHPSLPIEDIEMEAVNVFCSGLCDRDIAQTLLCQNFKKVSEAMSFYRRAIHSRRAVLGDYQTPSPSRPQIREVSEDFSQIDINRVDFGRNSATTIADLQVAMARMRSENLANQKLILSKLDEIFSLLKERPGSVDRNPSQPRHRHDDRNSSRSTHGSRGGHPSQTSTKVSGWSPSRSRQDHRDRSSSPLFLARTGERNPSRSPGPHVERQRSLSRERTNSPGSQRRTKEIRCYTCNGVGHFQSVCPSKEIKSVEFSDMDLLDLNSLGSG